MAVSFGVPGTGADDLRRVLGGWYNQGVVSGCVVTGRTDLKYAIAPGVVMNYLAGGSGVGSAELVAMPIASVTVSTVAGPPTGTRTDYVCVGQDIAGGPIEYIVLQTPPSSPGKWLVIAQFSVPAGMTRTSDATRSTSINYSTPYGSAGRYLVNKKDTFNNLIKNNNLVNLSGTFTLPTARLVEVGVTVTVDSDVSTGIYDALFANIWVDGSRKVAFSTGKIDDNYPQVHHWTWNTDLSAGPHTISLERYEAHDTGKIRLRYAAGGFPGTLLVVKDMGVLD